MPPDVTPAQPEPHRCQDCGTIGVYRPDVAGSVLICPNDDCHNIVVLALPTRDAELERAVELDAETDDPGVATIVAEADRVAAALLAEYQPADYSRTLAVVALAYTKGRRDGYAEGAKFVAEALDELSQDAAL